MTPEEVPVDPSTAEEVEVTEEKVRSASSSGELDSRDAAYWAKMVSRLTVSEVPEHAVNLNVEGRRVTSPVQGFGKMWQKTYRVALAARDVSPEEVVSEWKAHFASFWPKGNNFYGPFTALSPGDVAVLNLKAGGGMKLSTGVFVLYADEESFTFMTPQGHQFAAWITFSSFKDGDTTMAQVQPMFRTSDPLFEVVLPIMTRMEDKFWRQTLENLATHFDVRDAVVEREVVCVDKKRQWKNAKNVWHNSAVRSTLYMLGAPVRWVRGALRSG
jgi:hypothetical protein